MRRLAGVVTMALSLSVIHFATSAADAGTVRAERALAWGGNHGGQLGVGTTSRAPTPLPTTVALAPGTTLVAMAGGSGHTLALTSTGQVLAWGSNGEGQLGDGTTVDSSTPVVVRLPESIIATAVAGGVEHSLALDVDGKVWAWGRGSDGRLGHGTTTDSSTPVAVSLPPGTTATAVAAGGEHSLAVTSDGKVLAWGSNRAGQLGNGQITSPCVPPPAGNCVNNGVTATPVVALTADPVTAVAAGLQHSLALTSTGQALAWGANRYGQLGDGTTSNHTTPVAVHVGEGTTATALSAAGEYSLAVTSTGQALSWGRNSFGQLGRGSTDTFENPTPAPVGLPEGTAVAAVAAGGGHSLALTTSGEVLAWGRNDSGQLGDGTTTDRITPAPVHMPGDTRALTVDAGQVHSLALTVTLPTAGAVADFDGDDDTDRSVYRDGAWYAEGQEPAHLGQAGDVPVPADYDGDGDADRAVYRGGAWYAEGRDPAYFGLPTDVPVPADFDGDGDAERAVYRGGAWYVEGQSPVYFGLSGDVPVPADYDGDGDAERAVYRPRVGGWYVEGRQPVYFGLPGDVPVPGDYDGDGDAGPAVWRPKVGGWYVSGQASVFLGLAGDVPVPGDYDADGTTDPAVWRPKVGAWHVVGQPTAYLGIAGDVPLPLPHAVYRAFFS